MTEVRTWLDEGAATWSSGNFLVTPSRRRDAECHLIDIYCAGTPKPTLVAHVARLLAERNEATWTASQQSELARALWRSIANYALQLFQLILKPERVGQLEPVAADNGIGLAIAARSVTSGCGRLGDFAQRVHDVGRRVELDALGEAALTHAGSERTWLAFLGRLRILDVASGRQCQELDGVYALVGSAGVEWHFLEHKDGGASGMRGQLDELRTHLALAAPPCDFLALARGKAAHTQVTWR